jgi:hypothetical protein
LVSTTTDFSSTAGCVGFHSNSAAIQMFSS